MHGGALRTGTAGYWLLALATGYDVLRLRRAAPWPAGAGAGPQGVSRLPSAICHGLHFRVQCGSKRPKKYNQGLKRPCAHLPCNMGGRLVGAWVRLGPSGPTCGDQLLLLGGCFAVDPPTSSPFAASDACQVASLATNQFRCDEIRYAHLHALEAHGLLCSLAWTHGLGL
jgi:hypothetical protein